MKDISIATPYSHLFSKEADKASIISASDVIELRRAHQALEPGIRTIYHCELSIVVPWQEDDLAEIREIAKENQIEAVSFHLLSRYVKNDLIEGIFQGRGNPMSEQDMIDNAGRNIDSVRKTLEKNTCIMVENNNHLGTDAYDVVTEPWFIQRVIDENDISFLLDVAHGRITAHNTMRSENDYFNSLPLERCKQVHVSRHAVDNKFARDAHEALVQEDWDFMRLLVADSLPDLRFVTVEYYKARQVLLEQLMQLRNIIDDL